MLSELALCSTGAPPLATNLLTLPHLASSSYEYNGRTLKVHFDKYGGNMMHTPTPPSATLNMNHLGMSAGGSPNLSYAGSPLSMSTPQSPVNSGNGSPFGLARPEFMGHTQHSAFAQQILISQAQYRSAQNLNGQQHQSEGTLPEGSGMMRRTSLMKPTSLDVEAAEVYGNASLAPNGHEEQEKDREGEVNGRERYGEQRPESPTSSEGAQQQQQRPQQSQPHPQQQHSTQNQQHPAHPGPISLPPQAFPIPPPHYSPYHHPVHAIPPHLVSPYASPLYHPMHMMNMTPHGLPPITPSMPSFTFLPQQFPQPPPPPVPLQPSEEPQQQQQLQPQPPQHHHHQQQLQAHPPSPYHPPQAAYHPHPLAAHHHSFSPFTPFSPGVAMSPGALWSHRGAAVGAPVHNAAPQPMNMQTPQEVGYFPPVSQIQIGEPASYFPPMPRTDSGETESGTGTGTGSRGQSSGDSWQTSPDEGEQEEEDCGEYDGEEGEGECDETGKRPVQNQRATTSVCVVPRGVERQRAVVELHRAETEPIRVVGVNGYAHREEDFEEE